MMWTICTYEQGHKTLRDGLVRFLSFKEHQLHSATNLLMDEYGLSNSEIIHLLRTWPPSNDAQFVTWDKNGDLVFLELAYVD